MTLALAGLGGCSSSPETLADYRGYKYQYQLGEKYTHGDGVQKDPERAVYWYRMAATNTGWTAGSGSGRSQARLRLARAYRDGEGVAHDYNEALFWYKAVLEIEESAIARYEIGHIFRKGGPGLARNAAAAVQWYREAADFGSHRALYRLGEAYRKGEGVEQDAEEAVRLYEMAALRGDDKAQYRLSESLHRGEGVQRNLSLANTWLLRSAEQGNRSAMLRMGDVHRNGDGVARDAAMAASWYRKAAEAGSKRADARLESLASSEADQQI